MNKKDFNKLFDAKVSIFDCELSLNTKPDFYDFHPVFQIDLAQDLMFEAMRIYEKAFTDYHNNSCNEKKNFKITYELCEVENDKNDISA